MAKNLTKTQIAKLLKGAGIAQVEAPATEEDIKTNTFWFEGRDLVVPNDWTRGRATGALARGGAGFGGFRCGWGGWHLRQDYCLDATAELVHNNID